jgi:uncharacterized membrane protein YhaH (DUF805 family)
MNFTGAISAGFRNYFNFKGKASRSEFWFWVLFTILLSIVLSTLESVIWPAPSASPDWMQNLELALSQPTPLTTIAGLVLVIPNLSITARRFHDAGFSAKWLFIQIVPIAYGLFATVGVVTVLSNTASTSAISTEELMSLIFLIVPIFGLFIVTFVVFLILALRPSKSFYDGNRYVEPEPLSSMDEGTTA